MPFLRLNTPERKRCRHVYYLVHDLRTFDENVKRLFRCSADCLADLPVEGTAGEEGPGDGAANRLFHNKKPVTKVGRQTYRMWKASLQLSGGLFFKSNLLDSSRILHFIPLERFPPSLTSDFRVPGFEAVEFLVYFLRAYFPGLDVRLGPLHDVNLDLGLVSRHHHKTKKKQFLSTDLNTKLHRLTDTPEKDFILGLSWTDLYPTEDLNFVLGEAASQTKCAVLSFGRYEPQSYEENGEVDDLVVDGELLWKLLRVGTHEVTHLFAINHCVFFECSMNESSSVRQALSQPLTLCPVCLRKLQHFLKFNVRQRYENLLRACEMLDGVYPSGGMKKTVVWLRECIEFLHS